MSITVRLSNLLRRIAGGFHPGRNGPLQPQAVAIEHPTLGMLVGTTYQLKGAVAFGTTELAITIFPDGDSLESAIALGERVVNALDSVHEKCRKSIAEESLNSYNSDWRIGDVLQSDGSTIRFEGPELTECEFRSRLILKSLEVTGSQLASVWYECGDLFWGHSFNVTSFNGASFTDVRVELQG